MTSLEQFRQSIVGAWELTSYRCEPVEDGDVTIYPMTEDAEGIIMYTPDGYMSAQLMIPGVPKFADGDLSGGTTEELAAAGKSYLAYSGPYTVSEDANGRPVLKHTMEVSSFPNWLNNTQVRTTDMKGNKLTLSTDSPIITMGKLRQPILEWKKKKSTVGFFVCMFALFGVGLQGADCSR